MLSMKNNHLTIIERKTIEILLNEGYSFTEIANTINRSLSTVSREIRNHTQTVFPSSFNGSNICIKSKKCPNTKLECYKYCLVAEFQKCEKLNSATQVCNSCTSKQNCRHPRHYYTADQAEKEYLDLLHNSRTKLHYTEEEWIILNTDLVTLIRNNKSIFHSVAVINRRGYHFNESSIYRQISQGLLDIKASELPRSNRTKNNKDKDTPEYKRDVTNHTYEDYIAYKGKNSDTTEVQLDTVEGIKNNNQRVIFTIEIVEIKFLIAFIIDQKTQDKIIEKLKYLKDNISDEVFDLLMEILLTDNGVEFINPNKFMELSSNCNVFYCHPYCSGEKGNIENIHEFIRRIIPKGISLSVYTQEDINTVCNHINSLYRKDLDGKCAFDLVDKYIPIDKLEDLGFKRIDEDKVNLTPYLLGNKNIENIKKYLDKQDIKKANITIYEES